MTCPPELTDTVGVRLNASLVVNVMVTESAGPAMEAELPLDAIATGLRVGRIVS